jgi:hypothetical protein
MAGFLETRLQLRLTWKLLCPIVCSRFRGKSGSPPSSLPYISAKRRCHLERLGRMVGDVKRAIRKRRDGYFEFWGRCKFIGVARRKVRMNQEAVK